MLVAISAVMLGAVSAVAHAQRPATTSERKAVLAAAVRQRKVSTKNEHCYFATISTVDSHWALVQPAGAGACFFFTQDVFFEHHTARTWKLAKERWRWVTTSVNPSGVGQVQCPVSGVPIAVLRDLRQIQAGCNELSRPVTKRLSCPSGGESASRFRGTAC